MLISIVTGTYERLESLVRMVDSARNCIPFNIPHEIVVVDGGSQDGTIQWCKRQKDIVLIEHGELKGAIKAFCDGAKAAQGDYVILANDDVTFLPGSILAALVHLETNEHCGAVAFMDDRPLPWVPEHERYKFKAQLEPALDESGNGIQVVYAQVGMYRRWLGNLLGWWGADDPIMSQARTYGGDNWLSSRIWETGYTVDIVRGASVKDYVVEDDLRIKNANAHDKAYGQAYPLGPRLNSRPIEVQPVDERLRILCISIYEPDMPIQKVSKRGLREALAKRGLCWEWDYLSSPAHTEDVAAFAPHIVLTQFHDGRWSFLIDQLRQLVPDAWFINWCGDARGLTEPDYIKMLFKLDLQLVVNASALPEYERLGIPAAYWQIGYEEPQSMLPNVEAHDVLFMGNCYNDARKDIETALRSTGLNVGLYGFGWQKGDGFTLYDFAAGEALYQKCKIAVSDTFHDGKTPIEGFVSNRLFQALSAGAFLLQQHSPALDEFNGLQAGVHYVEWTDTADLVAKIKQYIQQPKERGKIARAGQRYVREHFSFDEQIRKLFAEILPRLEGEREHA